MYFFFSDFLSLEPVLIPAIFENTLETKSSLSGSIVGHVCYYTENILGDQKFSITNQCSFEIEKMLT